ncbi:IS66 family transposase [Enterobacter kobei]|uniref:IS66 family transposase n=1 Tax=Enterobacter kobei TaxID=208224 RepID=UPI002003F0A6|nr:transposase [Enterobacter kobei]
MELSRSLLSKAFAYALNRWPVLTYYADDGWAEADNSLAENVLRMVSLGRKICVRQKWLKGWTA